MSSQLTTPIGTTEAGSRLWAVSVRSLLGFALVGTLLVLGAANIALRATWHKAEDGVYWETRPEGVVARDIAPATAAAGTLRAGDILQAVNGQPIDQTAEVYRALDGARAGQSLRYTVLRLKSKELIDVILQPIPVGNLPLYFILAAIGIFTLLVGLSVRVRRPSDPATLHFFVLSVAFFALFTFSPSGRFDTLDWIFYWANEGGMLLLPPLFLHFTVAFPERSRRAPGSLPRALPLVYVPATLIAAFEIVVLARAGSNPRFYVDRLVPLIDRIEYLHLGLTLVAGFLVWVWALRAVRTVTGRRQLRWIVAGVSFGALPFVLGCALPYALGIDVTFGMSLLAIPLGLLPLAVASAIVRYRLMDVEVIIKRTLVYAAAVLAIGGIYAALLRLAALVFVGGNEHNTIIAMLATLVVVLLARPVKGAIQNTFDRAFYRDRYDYRRALLGFARDLNSDLDLNRLSDRLVARIMETFLVDRIALMLADDRASAFVPIRSGGFDTLAPRLSRTGSLGARLASGQPIALDDPANARGLEADEAEQWRAREIYYFIPCVSKDGCIAVLALGRRTSGEPLTSEDVSLLLAVAGQVATTLENGRLYRQLHSQAEEVDRMREFSDSIIESLEAGLVVVDADARVIRWNRALERLHGTTRAEAIGRPLSDLFDVGFLSQLHAVRAHAPNAAGVYRLPLEPRGRDARLLVNVTVVPLRTLDANGASIVGTIIILDDVTSRVHLEEQLQISEKMASIGILAAGVAHEVNTPLTGISSFTQMLLEGADPEDPKTKVLEKIERQTFRAARIVNGLLNLARPGSSSAERMPVDLNAVIRDVLSLLEHQFRVSKIQVRRDLVSPSPVISGFEFKLQQVFLNLFLNARDAMPHGGWLSIATRLDGDEVVVDVSDTGTGIPREYLSRIYDPFFTTKAIGQGTGLGLSITYGIVREHEGTITCESAAGEGTRFTLSFPLSAGVERQGRAAN